MKSRLYLQEFLRAYPYNWEEKLSSDPYNLKIRKEEDGRVLFMYNQIDSDFSEPLVRESRGIILNQTDNWSIVCRPFEKFFNLGEEYAASIDWLSADIQSKEDGSIVKLYNFKGEWRVATNGTIEAKNAPLQLPPNERIQTFEDLFYYTLDLYIAKSNDLSFVNREDFFNTLNSNYTYLYELATKYNKIVVPYDGFYLFFLTAKHNQTGKEVRDFKTITDRVKHYHFNTLKEVKQAAQELPYDNEGYVVVDKFNNRIKIKSPKFLEVFHLIGNEVPSERRIFDLILMGEDGEFLSYFPEYSEKFHRIERGLANFYRQVGKDMDMLFVNGKPRYNTRKEFAEVAKQTTLPGLIFQWYDGKTTFLTEYIRNMSQNGKDKIIKEIMKYE